MSARESEDFEIFERLREETMSYDPSDLDEDEPSVTSANADSFTTEDSEFSMLSSTEGSNDDINDKENNSNFDQVSILSKRKSCERNTDSARFTVFEPVFQTCHPNLNQSPKVAASTDLALGVKRLKVSKAIFAFFREHNVPMEAVEDPAFLELIQAIHQVKKEVI